MHDPTDRTQDPFDEETIRTWLQALSPEESAKLDRILTGWLFSQPTDRIAEILEGLRQTLGDNESQMTSAEIRQIVDDHLRGAFPDITR